MISPLILLPLALYGLVLALRGQTAGDHPTCERCGFDLYGRPKDSMNCPECGANVMRFGAIRLGRRERSAWMVLGSLGVVAALLAWIGIDAVQRASPERMARLKPVMWLTWEAKSGSNRALALGELIARIKASPLKPPNVTGAVNAALDAQADRKTPWDPAWGDFLEQLHAIGAVSNVQWGRYARQSVWVEKPPRSGLSGAFGDSLLPRGPSLDGIISVQWRTGRNTPLSAAINARLRTGRWDLPATMRGASRRALVPQSSSPPLYSDVWSVYLPFDMVAELPEGVQNGTVTFDLTISEHWGMPIATVRQAVPVPWVLPPGYRQWHARWARDDEAAQAGRLRPAARSLPLPTTRVHNPRP